MVVVSVSNEQFRVISDQLFYHCEVRPRILLVSVGDSNVYGTLAHHSIERAIICLFLRKRS